MLAFNGASFMPVLRSASRAAYCPDIAFCHRSRSRRNAGAVKWVARSGHYGGLSTLSGHSLASETTLVLASIRRRFGSGPYELAHRDITVKPTTEERSDE